MVDEQGKEQLIAKGFTVTVELEDTRKEKGKEVAYKWTER